MSIFWRLEGGSWLAKATAARSLKLSIYQWRNVVMAIGNQHV